MPFHADVRPSPTPRSLLTLLLLAAAACDSSPPAPTICTEEFVFGVRAEVLHRGTGAPLDVEGLAGFLVEGDYSESMGRMGNILFGAGERAGRYTVLVTAPGFEPWSREGVEVDEDECHVIPVNLTVRLAPEPSP